MLVKSGFYIGTDYWGKGRRVGQATSSVYCSKEGRDDGMGRGDGEHEKEPVHGHLGCAHYKAEMSRQEFLSGA